MFQYLKSIFNSKENNLSIKDVELGKFLELEYKHPNSLGIINSNSLTCTRLNQDELQNRKIQGFITSKYFDNNLRIWFLGIKSYKKNGNEMIERNYLFIENEIEKIRLLK
jgi:hypothetical protein